MIRRLAEDVRQSMRPPICVAGPDIEQRIRTAAETPSSKPYRPTRIASEQVGKWRDALSPGQVDTLTAVLGGFDLLPTGAPAGGGVRTAG